LVFCTKKNLATLVRRLDSELGGSLKKALKSSKKHSSFDADPRSNFPHLKTKQFIEISILLLELFIRSKG
jgi:hypothetical protein